MKIAFKKKLIPTESNYLQYPFKQFNIYLILM